MVPATDRVLADLKMYADLSTYYLGGWKFWRIILKTIFIRKVFPHLGQI